MRKTLAVMFVLSVLAVRGAAGADALLAYWKFDEGKGALVKDSSGHDNDGRIVGKPWWVKGKFGHALVLDGRTRVECASNALTAPGDEFTLELWMQDLGTAQQGRTWSGLATCGTYQLFLDPFPRLRLWVVHDGGKRGIAVEWDGRGVLDDGKWHHACAALSLKRGAAWIVVDGSVRSRRRVPWKKLAPREGSFAAGRGNVGFIGVIDELRVHGRALSPEELAQHYAAEETLYAERVHAVVKLWRGWPGGGTPGYAWGVPELWWYGLAKVFAYNAEINYRAEDATSFWVKGRVKPRAREGLFGVTFNWFKPLEGGYTYKFMTRMAPPECLPDFITVNDCVVWRREEGYAQYPRVEFEYVPGADGEVARICLVKRCVPAAPSLAVEGSCCAFWRFEEPRPDQAADSSGRGNAARLVGNTERVEGKVGRGAKFDGECFLRCKNAPSLCAKRGITIEFWLKDKGTLRALAAQKAQGATLLEKPGSYALRWERDGHLVLWLNHDRGAHAGNPRSTPTGTHST